MGYPAGTLSQESREKMRQAKLRNPTRPRLGKGKVKPRPCEGCGKVFMPKEYIDRQRFCSRQCRPPWNLGKKLHYKVWNIGGGVYTDDLRQRMGAKNKGKVRSEAFKEHLRKIQTKGNTPLYDAIRKCYKYKDWHAAVLKRDDYTCKICGLRGIRLQVDHHPRMFAEIVYDEGIISVEIAINSPTLWDVSCGRTLCYNCHIKHGRKKPNYVTQN